MRVSFAILILAACGGPPAGVPGIDASPPDGAQPGDGGVPDSPPDAPPDAPPDQAAPRVALVFPPPHSVTDAGHLIVRGTASDQTGVAAIRVNGILASTSDALATWRVDLALVPGATTIVVEAEDTGGRIDVQAARAVVIRRPLALIGRATGIAVDAAANRAVVTDDQHNQLLSVDLATGRRSVIVDATNPIGLLDPDAVALDAAGTRAFVAEGVTFPRNETAPGRVSVIDLATGAGAVVSDRDRGAGPAFVKPTGIALDDATGTALVTDTTLGALFAVDLATGDRRLVSGATTGTGPSLANVRGVAFDPIGHRALVLSGATPPVLLAVDLVTGARTVVSGAGVGTGALLSSALTVSVDAGRNRALLVDFDRLFAIDLATGDRTIVATAAHVEMTTMGFDPVGGRVIAFDDYRGALVRLDATTGAAAVLTDPDFGSGDALGEPTSVTVDAAGRAIVIDNVFLDEAVTAVDPATQQRTVVTRTTNIVGDPKLTFAVDLTAGAVPGHMLVLARDLIDIALATGTKTAVSGAGRGAGTLFTDPNAVVADPANGRAFVYDDARDVVTQVDLATGDRSRFAGVTTRFSGFGLGDLVLDAARNRLLLSEDFSAAVFAIDLTTRAQSVLSSADVGTGPGFTSPVGIARDVAGNRLLVADFRSIIAVDLATGDRSVVTGLEIGDGPQLHSARSIAIDVPGRALVTDKDAFEYAIVMAVDLETGHRVVVSAR